MEIFKESAVLRNNLITSGLYFYLCALSRPAPLPRFGRARNVACARQRRLPFSLFVATLARAPCGSYNELSTLTISKTSATTQSVANTAKRVIVIVGVAIALGESLEPIKLLGCSIGIGGVLLYSLVK